MKVPVSWLRDFVDIELSAEELANKLTFAGLEVEELEYVGAAPRSGRINGLAHGGADGQAAKGLAWDPAKIVVASPKDADIGVWKKIEESGEIGYFIQKSDFPRGRYYGPEEQNELISKIQKLIEENPTGVYAKTLR